MKYLKKFYESLEKTFVVPSEFDILIQDIGTNPTVSDIISCWNDCIEENPIISYKESSNLFILEDGENSPYDIFLQLNDYLMGDDVYEGYERAKYYLSEGATEKAAKRKDKNLEINPDKIQQMRKKVEDHVKSLTAKTKKIGNDLEIHLDGDHIAQVMFRKDYIGVKKEGNKFAKEFEYTELGKIKSELSNIIKSNEDLGSIRMSDEERDEYEKGRRIQSSTPRPEVKSGRLDDETLQRFKDEMKRNAEKDSQKVDPYFMQEISDRLYGPDSEEYILALKELNSKFRTRSGKTGHDIFKYLKKFNESFNESTIEENKKRIIVRLKKQYQLGIDVYKALLKDGGEKSILGRKKEIENYFNENRHIDLKSISRGSREISDSQSSPYYSGSILTYLDKSSFSASFFNMTSGQSGTFDQWFENEKIEPIVDNISELSNLPK